MTQKMSQEDSLELERRRLTEEVTESVEKTLRKRYTWLAIIMSFLIGGGVATIINNMTASARDKLVRTEIALDEIDELLKTGRQSIKELEDITEKIQTIKEETKTFNEEIEALSQAREISFQNLSKSLKDIEQMEERIKELVDTVNKIAKQTRLPDIKLSAPKITTSIEATQRRTEYGRYTVFLHYSNKEDKDIIKKLSQFLQKKGYIVPSTDLVRAKVRNIRYFHNEDMDWIKQLRENIYKFLQSQNIEKIPLPEKYFGDEYPNMRKGKIEVWLYFD